MENCTEFWGRINPKSFNKVLCLIPRDYYIDLVKRYDPENFLDLGCGYGETYGLLREAGIDVPYTGLDITEKSINVCHARYPGADFQVAAIQDIPFPSCSFEMVTCRAVLEHLPDPEPAIREMARVSSRVVVIVWFKAPGRHDKRNFTERGFWNNRYKKSEILEITSSAGLKLIETFRERRHIIWILERDEG